MFRIAVCDDNKTDAENILNLLNEYKEIRLDVEINFFCFNKASELLQHIKNGNVFDLFLLDVIMPEIDGVTLAAELRRLNINAPLVFLTFSVDYAMDAFNVSAVQYILKPINKKKLFDVLVIIFKTKKIKNDDFFLVSTIQNKIKIKFSSIVYIEAYSRTLQIHLINGSCIKSIKIREPFSKLIAPLLTDNKFLYAHTSFVLNMEYVEKLNKNSFEMVGGAEIPIPRYKYAEAKSKYLNYIVDCGIPMLGGMIYN